MRRLPCSISARTYTFVPLWIADIEKMQVESVAAYVAAIGGHAACDSGSPSTGPGPRRSPPRSPACRPSRPAEQPEQPLRPGKANTRACGTPPTRRDSRAARHDPARKITHQPTPQASTSAARKVEVSK
jgi:hypothetical protein